MGVGRNKGRKEHNKRRRRKQEDKRRKTKRPIFHSFS
jgi:hypothetical protein